MKMTNINEVMDIENKILTKLGYESGGYYKEQEENKAIYQAVKKALLKLDLSILTRRNLDYLTDENYHSLRTLIEDIRKELKDKAKININKKGQVEVLMSKKMEKDIKATLKEVAGAIPESNRKRDDYHSLDFTPNEEQLKYRKEYDKMVEEYYEQGYKQDNYPEKAIEYLDKQFPKGDKRRGEAMAILALAFQDGQEVGK